MWLELNQSCLSNDWNVSHHRLVFPWMKYDLAALIFILDLYWLDHRSKSLREPREPRGSRGTAEHGP